MNASDFSLASPFPASDETLSPLVRRLTCPNPGKMTGPGTNTYLVGQREVTVVDPGPAAHPAHWDRLVIAAGGSANIVRIVCTHTHPDHSPGVAGLKRLVPHAEVLAFDARDGLAIDSALTDHDVLTTSEYSLDVVHTPGHASNHLCFVLREESLMFSGDHVMEGSTVVIGPPDGDMADYLASLHKVQALGLRAIAPAHGKVIDDPRDYVNTYITHRMEREAQILDCVTSGRARTVPKIVAVLYALVRKELHPVAARSVHAHLLKLVDDGLVAVAPDETWLPAQR